MLWLPRAVGSDDEHMSKVLVAYASKHHATAEIAEAIAAELRARGLDADCVEAADATCTGYQAVVLGSAVYTGRWRKHARDFLKYHHDALATMPFWIFSSGPTGEHAAEQLEEESKWLEPHKVLDLAESAGVRGHTVFAGKVPDDPHGFMEKSVARSTPGAFRDARDWDAIRRWADEIADELSSAHR